MTPQVIAAAEQSALEMERCRRLMPSPRLLRILCADELEKSIRVNELDLGTGIGFGYAPGEF